MSTTELLQLSVVVLAIVNTAMPVAFGVFAFKLGKIFVTKEELLIRLSDFDSIKQRLEQIDRRMLVVLQRTAHMKITADDHDDY